jgi:DNA topoisomerase-1
MSKNLVIVESPAKAKTIEKFLGKDFKVESSFGHIADLPSKELGVDVEGDFKPKYQVSKDKREVVKKLKDLANKAEMVWLASDEDREGEAIAWHLAEHLKLDKNKTKRIVFHEITKSAIQKAIENPRGIDYDSAGRCWRTCATRARTWRVRRTRCARRWHWRRPRPP